MRPLSPAARLEAEKQRSNSAWLALLDIDIDGTMFYVVNNNEPVTSNGQHYLPYAFTIILPDDSMEADPQTKLVIDNVDRMLTDGLRAATRPPRFTLRVVLSNDPDTVEIELPDMELLQPQWNVSTITATLSFADIWNAAFPGRSVKYDPAQFPGMF